MRIVYTVALAAGLGLAAGCGSDKSFDGPTVDAFNGRVVQIGWMPVGKYSAQLLRDKNDGGKKAPVVTYPVPGGLTIDPAKTEYQIELGKGWKA